MTGSGAVTPETRKEKRAQHLDGDASSVQVAVRVRPMLPSEAGTTQCIDVLTDGSGKRRVVRIGGDSGPTFTFDQSFPGTTSQRAVFESRVVPLVQSCLEGYNATVLAYGQTGSGKTYSVMGPATSTALQDEATAGVIPRALRSLFDELEKTRQKVTSEKESQPEDNDRKPYEYEVRVQFLEVYGEEIHDLLSRQPGSERLTIRDVGLAEPEVLGATQHKVETAEEALLCLTRGMLRRVTGATAMNETSSRSHAILSVLVEQTSVLKSRVDTNSASQRQPEHVEVKRSKFNFVDLAGSERLERTHAIGRRMKEGININKGLLVLGNVISALGDPKKRGKTFVPYRDSKLTRLLKGSLGGNHKTLMIACVSPSSSNLEESLNCLRYANRAKNIQNKAVVNVDEGSRLVAELRGHVQALASELLRVHESGRMTEGRISMETLRSLAGGADSSAVTWDAESSFASPVQPTVVSSENGVGNFVQETEAELQITKETLERIETRLKATTEELSATKAEREMYRLTAGDTKSTGEGESDIGKAFLEKANAYEREIASLKESLRMTHAGVTKMDEASPLQQVDGTRSDVIEKASKVLNEEKEHLTNLQKELSRSVESTPGRQQKDDNVDSDPDSPELSHLRARVLGSISLAGQLDAEEAAAQAELSAMTKKYTHGGLSDEEGDDDPANGDGSGAQENHAGEGDMSSLRRRQQLEAHLMELSKSIDAKEELIEQLHLSQKKYATMRDFYEEKLRQMEDQVKEREMEREQLAQELKKLEESNPQKKDLQERLAKKDEHIAGLRQKKNELLSLTKVSSQNESQIIRLRNDVVSMKQKKVELQKQISHERRHHASEIKKLKREAMKREKEVSKYKKISDRKAQEAETAQRVAKSRLEEVGQLRSKYKEAEKKLRMQTLKRGVMEKAGLDPVLVGRRDTGKKNPTKGSLNVETIRDYLDEKIADVSRKEAIADKVAVEWEEHLELVSQKEELLSRMEDGISDEEMDALDVQIQYKEGRIRQLASRLGKQPSTSPNKNVEKRSFFDEQGFKSLFSGVSESKAARVSAKVLFGMVVRERRRVAALARTASSLDERVVEAEERASAIDAAFRSHMDEERDNRASMSQNQQEQILSLMAMVQERAETVNSGGGTTMTEEQQLDPQSISSGRIDSRALVLANERISVLEQQLRDMEDEKESLMVYKDKELETREALGAKQQECGDLEQEVSRLRSTLREIREAVSRNDAGRATESQEPGEVDSSKSGQVESLVERVLEIVSDSLHPTTYETPAKPEKNLGGRSSLVGARSMSMSQSNFLSPSLERHIELMNSSDSEEGDIPEWAGDIMEDLALIAEGEMPPSLRNTPQIKEMANDLDNIQANGSRPQKGNVFDRLTNPESFTGVQKCVATGKQQKQLELATDKESRLSLSLAITNSLNKIAVPEMNTQGKNDTTNSAYVSEKSSNGGERGSEDSYPDESTREHSRDSRSVFERLTSPSSYTGVQKAAATVETNVPADDGETDKLLDELLEDSFHDGTNGNGTRPSSKVEDYTQQNVFERLQRTTTHSYAVKQNAPSARPPTDLSASVKTDDDKHLPRTAAELENPAPPKDPSYTKQNVFERLQKTTTQAYAGKKNSSSFSRTVADQELPAWEEMQRPSSGRNSRSNSTGRASPTPAISHQDVFERLQRTTTHAYSVKHNGTTKTPSAESDRRL